MTEPEWLSAAAVNQTVREFVLPHLSERKHRLFACACCRRIRHLLTAGELHQGVEAAERLADGLISGPELDRVRRGVDPLADIRHHRHFYACAVKWALDRNEQFPLCSAQYASEARAFAETGEFGTSGYNAVVAAEQREQVVLLRDVLGNPFRPAAVDPGWRTETVLSLARGVYESRDFSAIPILADALQDAGCDNDDILDHCRDEKHVHVRGCWVVDLILAKS